MEYSFASFIENYLKTKYGDDWKSHTNLTHPVKVF